MAEANTRQLTRFEKKSSYKHHAMLVVLAIGGILIGLLVLANRPPDCGYLVPTTADNGEPTCFNGHITEDLGG